jgi:hypothetical protein
MAETEITFSVSQLPGGGYEARALGHSIFTEADTMDELRANVKGAVACHFGDAETLPAIRLVEVEPEGRRLGLAKDEFAVPDDFNDPLPKEIEDLFWK